MTFLHSRKTAYILVLTLFLSVRLIGLNSDLANSDGLRWYYRSDAFLQALKQHNFKDTYQHYQPGETLMWINASVREATLIYDKIINPGSLKEHTLGNSSWFTFFDQLSKSVLVVILALIFIIQVLLIEKLYSRKIALTYAFLISLEPYLVGIDRWFHLTSLETYSGFCALLFLLVWIKNHTNKYLILSAVLLAVSALSKLTSISLVPLFLIIIYFNSKNLKLLSVYALVFCGAFFIAFPAMWVNLPEVLTKLFSAAKFAVDSNSTKDYLMYLNIILYRLSPLTLFLFIISIFSLKKFVDKNIKLMLVYIVYYIVLLSFADKKIDRYILVIFPSMLLIISILLSHLRQRTLLLVLSVVALFFVYVVYFYYPVYSAYYSPVFGGTAAALKYNAYDNNGEYFAQAALYLNSKGRDIKTYVPDNIDAFSPFYKGKLESDVMKPIDYEIRSIDTKRKIPESIKCQIFDHTFGPRDYPVVYVFRCQ